MEEFKKFDEINKPDIRNTFYVAIDKETGTQHPITLKDVYESISLVNLSDSVPEEIRSQFNIVKNLYLYTWHCYAFFQVVELKCFSVLEYALKWVVSDEDIWGAYTLILKAVETGKITEEFIKKDMALEHITENHYKEFARSFSNLRNTLAHGSTMLHSLSLDVVYRCSLLINHLFEDDSEQAVDYHEISS